MSRDRIIQVYRGTTAQNNAFTGAAGEITMDTTRKELRVHDGSTAGGNLVGLKPGFVCPFAGTTAPDGWLICDGSAVSRTTYADLFAVIGTTYGAGDGNSTFNLPLKPWLKMIGLDEAVPIIDGGGTLALEKVLWYYSNGSPMSSSQSSMQYFAAAFGNNFILDTNGHGALGSNYHILYKSQILNTQYLSGLYMHLCIKY